MKKYLVVGAKGLIVGFAIIGFVMVTGYTATYFGFTNTKGTIDEQTSHFISIKKEDTYTPFLIENTPEWIAFKQAVAKDKKVIDEVSRKTGVPGRLLVAVLVPEQMRLFYSDRALFKRIFEPLKILGSQSQFSWGIFGIKDDTARAVESHLKDTTSPFYLGKKYETMLDFTTNQPDQERFTRIVDEHNHMYSYLYAALYLSQIEAQWEKEGYSILKRPEIMATLWNLGFEKSKPNKNPKSGGSVLTVEGKEYSFGAFAYDFYYSDELIELFPR